MANIVLDFLHNYQTGERRESEPANAYQYDEGHVLEAVLPEVITSCEIHYWIRGMEEADAYTPTSITPNEDNSCTVLGNIPNSYFETNGELRVYIVVTDGTASITTYEGKLHICQRSMPDDYVDDDPENEATRVLVEAQEAAQTATEQAEAAAESAEQAAESARTLTLDTTLTQSGQAADAKAAGDAINDLKDDLSQISNELIDVEKDVFEFDFSKKDITSYGDTFTGYSGAAGTGEVDIAVNASYDTYSFIVARDTKIYVDASYVNYYALIIGTNPTGDWYAGSNNAKIHDCESAVRYRKSQGDLPTANNPLTINKGALVVITVTAGATPYLYIYERTDRIKVDDDTKIVATVSADEIKLATGKYQVTFSKQSTTQGYQWILSDLKGKSSSILPANTDIIGVMQFTGQSNFMGGMHGNESVVSFEIMSNGADVQDGGKYDNVHINIFSHLYDPDNTSNNVVDRFVEYIFTPNGWECRITFKMLTSATINVAYPCGLFGFVASQANFCTTNIGVLDLSTTSSRPFDDDALHSITVNLTDNTTLTIEGFEYDGAFIVYRDNTLSFKVYWDKARNQSVANGDYVTGKCRYTF